MKILAYEDCSTGDRSEMCFLNVCFKLQRDQPSNNFILTLFPLAPNAPAAENWIIF